MSKPLELLAPAGDWDCARAAVENGADAVYFGLDAGFNARARARNFHLDDLPRLMTMLHRQAVRGYVTLNTLVFTDELSQLETNVRMIAEAGADAVIVQDIGAVRLIRELCPDLKVHASTQMTLTNAPSINRVSELGVSRVVLARELSIREIAAIANASPVPLEVFVHGALCVAYSGQCLTSESFGGRSANRGQCAQACRLPYDLYCDGERKDMDRVKYLLSPQDLAAHDLVPQLVEAGVSALKIEGRLKTPEYVANVCSHYRRAIDAVQGERPARLSRSEWQDLAMSFSRGFSPGWLEGCDHKRLVPGESSTKQGVLLGTVQRVDRSGGQRIQVKLLAPLRVGDGIVFEGDRAADQEVGGRVYELATGGKSVQTATAGQNVLIGLKHGILERFADDEPTGLKIWKTDDPKLTKRLRKSFSGDPRKKVDLDVTLHAAVDQPIRLTVRVERQTPQVVDLCLPDFHPEEARKHPATQEGLYEQLARLGDSIYRLRDLETVLEGNPMIPLSIMGKLRHMMIERLEQLEVVTPHPCQPAPVSDRLLRMAQRATASASHQASTADSAGSAELRVLCRSLQQLEMVLDAGVERVIADFQDIRQYRDAIRVARQHTATIELATLRIHKPGEDGLFKALRKLEPDGWLARNLAAIDFCNQHQIPVAADFSLNVTNPLSARQVLDWGATRVTAAYDLNRDQLLELVTDCDPSTMEIVIHQHMPMFHMEHCVFCSVLSPGKNKSDCGRPCDHHQVQLRDRVGASHVLHADIGCRNTLYNGTAQSGAEAVRPLMNHGIHQFRIELLRDLPVSDVRNLIELYRQLLQGKLEGAQVWKRLKAENRVGVTRGTLEQPRNPLAIL